MSQFALAFAAASELPEPLLYHDVNRSGFVSLFTPGGERRQRSCRLSELPLMLASVNGQVLDTYLSQHEFFKPNRQLVNCKRLTSLYIDIDGYKDVQHCPPSAEAQLDSLMALCELQHIPPPTVVVHSGRGLQAKWVLEKPVPPAVTVRWQAVQQRLWRQLKPLGADAKALDVSRVLRLVGTVNTKNGVVAREVFRSRTPTMGAVRLENGVIAYPFDVLADTVLPLTRAQLEEERRIRTALAVGEATQGEVLHSVDRAATATEFEWLSPEEWTRRRYTRLVPAQLAWDRLSDLRRLVQVRGWHKGVDEGYRDTFLFLSGCFLAWTGLASDLQAEMRELAHEFVPTWSHAQVDASLRPVYARCKSALAGEKVVFKGMEVDPRYRYTNNQLVELLSLEPHEEREMKTIISKNEARRRNSQRHEDRRREQGCLLRDEYCARSTDRRAQARQMKAKGKSLSQIAKALGVSKSTVAGYCKGL